MRFDERVTDVRKRAIASSSRRAMVTAMLDDLSQVGRPKTSSVCVALGTRRLRRTRAHQLLLEAGSRVRDLDLDREGLRHP